MANNETHTKAAPKAEMPLPTFDPMAFWAQSQATITKLMSESVARWQAFADQYASIEQQVASHANAAVTNWAQLAKDAIAYGQQLSAEARKLSIETAKKLGVQA